MPLSPPLSTALDTLRADVRAGRSCLVVFDRPGGIAWLDILGPAGMLGNDRNAFTAPVATVRLWPVGGGAAPLAVAAANHDFPAELDELAERARPVVQEEWRLLVAVLTAVREATMGTRARIPVVGEHVTEHGTPSVSAWASCLTLGDLQAALLRSARLRTAA